MSVHQIQEPEAYVRYLQSNPHEIDTLFSELLISVTSFFRDPEAYTVLAEEAIPGLLEDRREDHTLGSGSRVCHRRRGILGGHGLARVHGEAREAAPGADLRHGSGRGRSAWPVRALPEGIESDMSEAVWKSISCARTARIRSGRCSGRSCFRGPDVIKDPPFTKIDLLVCRNLLIYLDGEPRAVVAHFPLRAAPAGPPLLGPSESVGGVPGCLRRSMPGGRSFGAGDCNEALPGSGIARGPREERGEDGMSEKMMPAHLAGRSSDARKRRSSCSHGFAPASVIVDGQGTLSTSTAEPGPIWSRRRDNSPATTSWRWPGKVSGRRWRLAAPGGGAEGRSGPKESAGQVRRRIPG